MQTSKVKALQMLENGQIEELKALLRDDIYQASLRAKPTEKKRYAGMKRYLKTISTSREILRKPCAFKYEEKTYNAFCSGYSLALTTESCGELEMCSTPESYPDLSRLITFDGDGVEINIKRVLAEAKKEGYKFKKSVIYNNEYLMHYNGAYFRIGLVDVTYGVIADGDKLTIHHGGGARRPVSFRNDIGIGMVMPVYIDDLSDSTIIQALK